LLRTYRNEPEAAELVAEEDAPTRPGAVFARLELVADGQAAVDERATGDSKRRRGEPAYGRPARVPADPLADAERRQNARVPLDAPDSIE
jgi:hypothetical protein